MPKIPDLAYADVLGSANYVIGVRDGKAVRFPTSLFTANKWHFGTAAPNQGTGSNEDFYLNITTGDVYQKVDNSWGTSVGTVKGADGSDGVDGTNGTNGVSPLEIYYSLSGTLELKTGKLKRYIRNSHTIAAVKVYLGTASVGGNVKFDIKKNGVAHSIFSNDAEIVEGQTSASFTSFLSATLNAEDYLTVDITAVGATVPGSDLSITILMN